MKNTQIKFSRAATEGLLDIIKKLIHANHEMDDDKLLVATLSQIGEIISKQYGDFKPIKEKYCFTLNDAQQLALRILSTDYELDYTTYMGNVLHQISNQVAKKYQ